MKFFTLLLSLFIYSCKQNHSLEQEEKSDNRFHAAPQIGAQVFQGSVIKQIEDNEDHTNGRELYILHVNSQFFLMKLKPQHKYIRTGDVVNITGVILKISTLNKMKLIDVKSVQLLNRAPVKVRHAKNNNKASLKTPTNLNLLGVIVYSDFRPEPSSLAQTTFANLLEGFKQKVTTASFGKYSVSDIQIKKVKIVDDADTNLNIRKFRADEKLKSQGIDPETFKHVIYLGSTGTGLNYGNLGTVSKPQRDIFIHTMGNDLSNGEVPLNKYHTLFHEWGHNLGMGHSNHWEPNLNSYYQENQEYGDRSAIMGNYHCDKTNFVSFNARNVHTYFLDSEGDKIKELDESSGGEHKIQVLNSTQEKNIPRILKFTTPLAIDNQTMNLHEFYVSLVRQCSQTGTDAHNILVHHESGNKSYIVAELKPGMSFTLGNHEVTFQSFNSDFTATLKYQNK